MKLLPVFLLMLSGIITFNNNLIQLEYWINPSRSVKSCINKEKPLLQCRGKCQVAKKIAEQEENTEKGMIPARAKFPEVTSTVCLLAISSPETILNLPFYPAVTDPLSEGTSQPVFHPRLMA